MILFWSQDCVLVLPRTGKFKCDSGAARHGEVAGLCDIDERAELADMIRKNGSTHFQCVQRSHSSFYPFLCGAMMYLWVIHTSTNQGHEKHA